MLIALVKTLVVSSCWVLFLVHSVVNLGGLSPSMAVVKGADRLSEHFPNEVFSNVILWLSAPTNQLLKVSTITMFHNDKDFGLLLIYYSIIVFHNIRVIQFSEYIDFRYNLLLFFFCHDTIIHLFPHKVFIITNSIDFLYFAETSYRIKVNWMISKDRGDFNDYFACYWLPTLTNITEYFIDLFLFFVFHF